jgi:uncharacterized protein YcbK (DUF882 family)
VQISRDFFQSEFECPCILCKESGHSTFVIDNLLLDKLQEVRDELKQPIVINSGFRCDTHNKTVGGKTTSSHLLGRAADIGILVPSYRYELLRILLTKFNRIGIGKEFIHVDVDHDKTQNLTWVY